MIQLIEKARLARNYIQDHEQPLWKRVHNSLQAYSKLKFSGLPSSIKNEIEKSFASVNAIFSGYEINSFDDYQKIAADDLMEILNIVERLSTTIVNAEQ